jgi:molybdopterin synthase sulfur carrier subunit
MAITVKLVGALRHFSGINELALDCTVCMSIRDLMNEVVKELPSLERSLIDRQFEDQRSNALVLVNGREISVLNGLETELQDGDEVVLVPFVHGG